MLGSCWASDFFCQCFEFIITFHLKQYLVLINHIIVFFTNIFTSVFPGSVGVGDGQGDREGPPRHPE